MAEKPLNQSSPRRAWEETKESFHKIWFFWGVQVVAVGVFALLGTIFAPENSGRLASAVYPVAGGAVGAIVGFGIIYLICLIKAPYKQRDEARKQLMELKNRLAEAGYVEALTWDCIELSNKLKSFSTINNHDRSQFQKWSIDVLNYLDSKNRHQESLQWLRDVSINNVQSSGYEDVLRAYDAGYNILLELHKKLTD